MRRWIKFKLIERKKKDGWHYPDIKRPVRVEAKQDKGYWLLLVEGTQAKIDKIVIEQAKFNPVIIADDKVKNEIVKLLKLSDDDITLDAKMRVRNKLSL